jgi:hypothetical protein
MTDWTRICILICRRCAQFTYLSRRSSSEITAATV